MKSTAIPRYDHSSRATDPKDVKFTRRQAEYLDRVFGEVVGTGDTTDAELRINQGRRQVVKHIMGLIDG